MSVESCYTWILMNIQVTQPMLMQSSGIPARQCVAEVYGQYLVTQPQVRRRKLSTIYCLLVFTVMASKIKSETVQQIKTGMQEMKGAKYTQRPSTRFRSVQFFICKILGEMNLPNLYSFVSRRHVSVHKSGTNMATGNQPKHLSLNMSIGYKSVSSSLLRTHKHKSSIFS